MDADAAAGEDMALAINDDGVDGDRDGDGDGDGDGGWCDAAAGVDMDAADETGEGW